MSRLYGLLALLCWLALGAMLWGFRGAGPERFAPGLAVAGLLALVCTGLWLSARRRGR